MPCACNKNRQKYEVVTEDGAGKVVFGPSTEATCKAVSKRYPGSVVREKPAASPAKGTAK